jgi:hypothetical protein
MPVQGGSFFALMIFRRKANELNVLGTVKLY